MVAGVVLGYVNPDLAKAMKPLGDGFIKLIRMVIAPIVFVTVVSGIYKMQSTKEVGRIGVRAIVYFEVVSTLALLIGIAVALLVQPGAGINADPASLDAKAVDPYIGGASKQTATEFLLNIIPSTLVGAFSEGQILQVMFVAILTGLALLKAGDRVRPVMQLLDQASAVLFTLLGLIMTLAAIGTFGGMAFTVGAFGLSALKAFDQVCCRDVCHLHPVYAGGPGDRRSDGGFSYPEVHRVHQRRDSSRAGHVVFRSRTASSDDQARATRMPPERRWVSRSHRLFIEHRRLGHLSLPRRSLHCSGDRHFSHGDGNGNAVCSHAPHVERRCRRLGINVRYTCCDAGKRSDNSRCGNGSIARH
jgi:hypothetical protein